MKLAVPTTGSVLAFQPLSTYLHKESLTKKATEKVTQIVNVSLPYTHHNKALF